MLVYDCVKYLVLALAYTKQKTEIKKLASYTVKLSLSLQCHILHHHQEPTFMGSLHFKQENKAKQNTQETLELNTSMCSLSFICSLLNIIHSTTENIPQTLWWLTMISLFFLVVTEKGLIQDLSNISIPVQRPICPLYTICQ